jgi:hypothetical protein
MAPPAAPTITKLGDYEILVGGSPVAFWPLDTTGSLASALPPIVASPATPGTHNTVVVPVVGIFDIIVRAHDGIITASGGGVTLTHSPAGKATLKKAPLELQAGNQAHIRFAVDHSKIAAGGTWQGSLRLNGKGENGASSSTAKGEVTLQIARSGTVTGLVVFFVAHAKTKKYGWVTLKALAKSSAAAPIKGATIDLKVLRDNSNYGGINRRISLTTDASGNVIGAPDRKVIAVPSDWPLIFSLAAASHMPLGHMIRLKPADTHDNLAPVDVGPARMLPRDDASLAGKKFVFDAGHGVVYAYKPARRSQEWYVAHKIADRVAEVLIADHEVEPDDISWTRSAGFGLIDPSQVHAGGAPEAGESKYKVDLPRKLIAANTAAVGLHQIAELLLTRHSDPTDAVIPLTASDYGGFLMRNAVALNGAMTRLNTSLAATHERVQPGSVHWDATTKHYVYVKEKKDSGGTWVAAAIHPTFPITTADWFLLDTQAIHVLAERSARWSLTAEIGGVSAFAAKARVALRSNGAVDYYRDKIIYYLDVPVGAHPYLAHGTKAWSPGDRGTYLSNNAAGATMVLTLHENAGGGKGGMVLVSHKSGPDAPPPDEIRIAKTFVKYLDAFDQGVRQGGVATDLPGNPAGMLYHGNTIRARYAYFETEFMDGPHPDGTAGRYAYEAMVTPRWISDVAHQIVWGMIEWILAKQANLDPVTYSGGSIGGLW